MKEIKIKNAYLHNLKNIDISIPGEKLVVVTGVSGSGKSSLVFDLLYKEGREAYLSSIGFHKPIEEHQGFDSIKGICPAIAVQQRIISQNNPRSVVGTRTKVLEYLKLLYSLDGKMICRTCGSQTDSDFFCKTCNTKYEKPELKVFSFNSVKGMCPECEGRGIINTISLDKVLRNGKVSLVDICKPKYAFYEVARMLDGFAYLYKFDKHEIYNNLPDEVKDAFANGFEKENIKFEGIIKYLERRIKTAHQVGELVKVVFSNKEICPKCHGYKLNDTGRSVLLGNRNIAELCNLTIKELKQFLIEQVDLGQISKAGIKTIDAITGYIDNLIDAGLSYLTLYRETSSLSGGELQRLFLMSHLGSKMDSLLYVFDEPTSGLHESEKEKLLNKIEKLRDIGNSIIIVEHDKNTMERAEHLIEFGPLAGEKGGQVIYQGDYEGILNSDVSMTGSYLSGKKKIYRRKLKELNRNGEQKNECKYILMKNVCTNNLKGIDIEIPLSCMVGIAGVSGSGKSSLIADTLFPELENRFKTKKDLNSNTEDDGNSSDDKSSKDELNDYEMQVVSRLDEITGLDKIKGFVEVSQSPIGRNSRSIPISYLGIWDKIRDVFAKLEESKIKGYRSGHFSFSSEGACPSCKGTGNISTFIGDANLPFLYGECPECNGKRYNKEVLKIRYKDKNILDVLNMSVSEALEFFADNKNITKVLSVTERIGMGYMSLGQPSSTLSGGEAQRIKLAKEIAKANGKKSEGRLYIFDEPTTGLSFYDIDLLLPVLDELVQKGNSVIVIEHDPAVLSNCDWIIELGPGGGTDGGSVIAQGTPIDLVNNPYSVTGKYLFNS